MKRTLIIVSIILWFIPLTFLGFVLFSQPKASVQVTQTEPPSSEKLFEIINNWRINSGFAKYERSEELCKIAKDRAKNNFDFHKGLYKNYSNYTYAIQENLVQSISPGRALISWLNSPPHRATLEKPYQYSCVVCDKQCVQIFSNFTDEN